MNALTMAWRNVWRNSRRTLATVGATTLGLLAMILYAGLVDGYLRGMERNILDLEMGDVQIHASTYRESPSLHHRIESPGPILESLDDDGLHAAPRLLGSGLGAARDTSAGISLLGIDVERDAEVSTISQHLAEGQWLDPQRPGEVVIGRHLARMLGVGLGDEIVVLSQAADGSTANDVYTVRGVLQGISDQVDRTGVFMVAAAFRELMVVPEGAHRIIVRGPKAELPDVARRARAAAPELDTKTWRELQPTLASMLDAGRGGIMAMFIIIYIAIAIVILNATLMAVFERTREFGVLKALGVGPGGVLQLIVLETAMQTALAIVVATTISIPANWYMSTHGIDLRGLSDLSVMGVTVDPIWRSHVTVDTYVRPVVILLFIVSIAVLYPATRAALIRPIEAMRSR